MICFVITDGRGRYIRKDDYSGKYVPVKNIKLAQKFDAEYKAKNIIKNAIPKKERKLYRVNSIDVPQEDEDPVKVERVTKAQIKEVLNGDCEEPKEKVCEIQDVPVAQEVNIEQTGSLSIVDVFRNTIESVSKEDFDDGMENLSNGINSLIDLICDCQDRRQELCESLSVKDRQISDVLHYVEFNKLDMYKGYLAYRLLHELTNKRRRIKDELNILTQLGDCNIDVATLNSIRASIVAERTYSPRELNNLFV